MWLGQSRGIIVLAILATFFRFQVWETVVQLGESVRLTYRAQSMTLCIDIVYCSAVLILWKIGSLTLPILFTIIFSEYFLALLISIPLIWKKRQEVEPFEKKSNFTIDSMFKEYSGYCGPLVLFTFAGFAYQFADRWMLQNFSGGQQQGFFEIGYRFSIISMVATSSILRIFWKEIAEAVEQNNDDRIKDLFQRSTRILFTFSALISCLLIPWSKEIRRFISRS